jgi:hypothetical protein
MDLSQPALRVMARCVCGKCPLGGPSPTSRAHTNPLQMHRPELVVDALNESVGGPFLLTIQRSEVENGDETVT